MYLLYLLKKIVKFLLEISLASKDQLDIVKTINPLILRYNNITILYLQIVLINGW